MHDKVCSIQSVAQGQVIREKKHGLCQNSKIYGVKVLMEIVYAYKKYLITRHDFHTFLEH